MKPSHWILASLIGVAAVLPVPAAPKASVADSRIQVEFVNPDKFTDLRAEASGSRKGRGRYLEQLKGYLIQQAGGQLPQAHA